MINIKRQQPKIDEHTHKFVDCAVLIVLENALDPLTNEKKKKKNTQP